MAGRLRHGETRQGSNTKLAQPVTAHIAIASSSVGIDHILSSLRYTTNSTFHQDMTHSLQEQLYRNAQYWASTAIGDQRDRYAAAARSFRMPYWDWARGEEGGAVPEFFTTEQISVSRPNGSTSSMWNPLYTYRFSALPPDGFNDKVRLSNIRQERGHTDIALVGHYPNNTALARL